MVASSTPNKQMASTVQSWHDRAIERSRVLTDAFEVALTWAGGLADWILFLCLVSNIVEVLAHLAGTPFSNIVMGTQSILLDIGGFALLTMAVHAHQRGERHTRNSAAFIGGLLMLVTLATVVLITVGNLWPKAADQVQNINQALILARIGMTIVYECTIHLLRHAETHSSHVQQAQVHQAFTERLSEIEQDISRQVSEKIQSLDRAFSERLERAMSEQKMAIDLTPVYDLLREHTQALSDLAALPARLETQWKQAIQEAKAEAGKASVNTPRLSLVGAKDRSVKTAVKAPSESASEKGAFVRSCLTEHPDWRNSEIQRVASEKGLTISPAHISQVRKALSERTA